jgi:hypothetical protein
MKKRAVRRLIRWLLFNVTIGLLPIMFTVVRMLLKGLPPVYFIPSSELLLVSVVIAGTSIGELVGSGKNRLTLKYFVGGISVILLCFATFCFAEFSHSGYSPHNFDGEIVQYSSIAMFCCILVLGGISIVISEM